jgi:hypothetical protein
MAAARRSGCSLAARWPPGKVRTSAAAGSVEAGKPGGSTVAGVGEEL